MGVWESVYSAAETVRNRLPDPIPAAKNAGGAIAGSISGGAVKARDLLGGAASKARSASPDLPAICRKSGDYGWSAAVWLKEAAADRSGWERIGRIAWRVTDHALSEVTRPYTGGIPVYRYLSEEVAKSKVQSPVVNKRKQDLELQELRKRVSYLENFIIGDTLEKNEDLIREFKFIDLENYPEKSRKFVNWKPMNPIDWKFGDL